MTKATRSTARPGTTTATAQPPRSVTRTPIGWTLFVSEPMQFFVTGAYCAVDSNIDFYNQEAKLGMGGIVFRWK